MTERAPQLTDAQLATRLRLAVSRASERRDFGFQPRHQ